LQVPADVPPHPELLALQAVHSALPAAVLYWLLSAVHAVQVTPAFVVPKPALQVPAAHTANARIIQIDRKKNVKLGV
jgi:hypothetical protein